MNWNRIRGAIRKRIKTAAETGVIGWSDVDDATQDAVFRFAELLGKTGKPVGWCVVVAAKRELRFIRAGYRPLIEAQTEPRQRWEGEIDQERLIGAPLDREEMVERGLISAQELRLAARVG